MMRTIIGNYNLLSVKYIRETKTLIKQTYSDGNSHYAILDGFGRSRVELSSGDINEIKKQLEHENNVYRKYMNEITGDNMKKCISANEQFINYIDSNN